MISAEEEAGTGENPEQVAARRGLALEDVAPAAMLRAKAGAGA